MLARSHGRLNCGDLLLIAQIRAVCVSGRAVEQLAIGDDEGVVLLEDNHRVTALGSIDDEGVQAGCPAFAFAAVALPGVVDGGRDCAS